MVNIASGFETVLLKLEITCMLEIGIFWQYYVALAAEKLGIYERG